MIDVVISHALAIWTLQPLYKELKQRDDTIIEKMYKGALSGTKPDDYIEYEQPNDDN